MTITSACEKEFLDFLIENQSTVSVYLKNGIRLRGTIVGASNTAIFLKEPTLQLVYKHQISTVCTA